MPICVKNCKTCGCQLVWEYPELGINTESSANVPDWPICHGCMVEHCVSTNCLSCGYGEYPGCQFLSLKQHYRNND